MKLSEIKKELGGKGVIIEIETFSSGELVAYKHQDIHYNFLCRYNFEKFINLNETNSDIVKFICEKYGVERVFAYQNYGYTEERDAVLLGEDKNHIKYYDNEVMYLVAVSKSVSDAIPAGEGELIK